MKSRFSFSVLLPILFLLFAMPLFGQSIATDIDGNQTQSEVRVGTNGQVYSDGRNSSVGFIDAFHRLNSKIMIEGLVQGGEYFGSNFGSGGGSVIVQPTKTSYFQVGGARNSHTDTTQAFGAFFEAGTLVYRAPIICGPDGKNLRDGLIKAVEIDYNQTWQGFGIAPIATDVHTFNPRVIFYLPRDIDFMLRGGVVDIVSNGKHNPTPLGGARLRVPVTHRLGFTTSVGFDSEGVTNIAQLLQFSTRNYGAGASYWVTNTVSVEGEGFLSLYTANKLSGNTYRVVLRKRF